ncbi:MAG: tetratricopeptide repeat protein [Planctomycetota bacterium]|jgi:serine/threonine protein kinase
MSGTHQKRVRELFLEATERPADERTRFLVAACNADESVRSDVQALLDAYEHAPDVLPDSRMIEPETASLEPVHEGPGSVIGRYKILQTIGEGGFGVVYMAEQTRPVQRTVALKIIKLGMDTKQVIARFEAERQALALMDHPNIARVLDAGATETGRPYFVMELVRGVPITEYCDTHKLDADERLELFLDVCHAVQHAHQKGIIHRDLKPGNVMVTLHDGRPVPKVIDFGIAKAINQKLTERTLFTEYRHFVGTPEYMSPEQAEMSGLDIDTRSDIYSLGVLLYELLTGTRPFDARRLREAGYGEIQRIIREEEPERPSTRLSSLIGGGPRSRRRKAMAASEDDTSVDDIARLRHTDPASLARELQGDLDWIVMRCLEKDRTRRYETANGLALDIRRHMSHEPVSASPPSTAYRFRKFARRNRGLFATTAVVVTGLVLGLTVAVFGLVEARNALGEKVESLEREQAAREEAQVILDFLSGMLAAPAPAAGESQELTFPELLRGAAERIDEEFAERPLVAARLHFTIGRTFQSLGLYSDAEPHKRTAWNLRREHLGEEHPDTLTSAMSMASFYRVTDRLEEAEQLLMRTAATRSRLLGPEHEKTLSTLNELGRVYGTSGKLKEAEELFQDGYQARRRLLGDEHNATITSLHNLAWIQSNRGELEDAERLMARVLDLLLRSHEPDDFRLVSPRWTLANIYRRQARFDEAAAILEQVVEAQEDVRGKTHPSTLSSKYALALVYEQLHDYEKAEELYKAVRDGRWQTLGLAHQDTVWSLIRLGWLYHWWGRYEEAEPIYQQVLDLKERRFGRGHLDTASALGRLAWLYQMWGRFEESRSFYERELAVRAAHQGPDHPLTLATTSELGGVHLDHGQLERGAPLCRTSVEKALELVAHPTTELTNELGWHLNIIAWAIVRHDGLDPTTYEMATEAAVKSVELTAGSQQEEFCVNTLGVPKYRVGGYEQAIDLLGGLEELRKAQESGEDRATRNAALTQVSDIAVISMALYQLGREENARAGLGIVHSLMTDSPYALDFTVTLIVEEAERLIGTERP